MKRIISIFVALIMLLSVCSFSALAADDRTITLTTNATDNKVYFDQEFVVSAYLDTNKGTKAATVKIAYDPEVLALGTSNGFEGFVAAPPQEVEEAVNAGDFTWEEAFQIVEGIPAWVDDNYLVEYKSLADNKRYGSREIGNEVKADGTGLASFAYASGKAFSLVYQTNYPLAGVILKPKTEEKMQTTISIFESTYTDSNGATHPATLAAELVLNLNGYGEVVEPEDPYDLKTDYVAAAKNIPVTSQNGSYNVNTALIFGSSINTGSATTFGTEITLKDYEGKPLDIVASDAAKYVAGVGKTGFTAAVTSIREANLDKTFVAKAYAVDANGEKVYGEAAEAVFSKIAAN